MFEPGRIYVRNRIHEAWGGTTEVQRQGGILTPVEYPAVLVVTGAYGARYGYHDWWDNEGFLHYYGAGQEGHMEFVRGNKALRDHVENGKEVHLFEQAQGGLRYVRQVVVGGWYERDGVPDRLKNKRRGIIFKLVPVEALDEALDDLTGPETELTTSLDELRSRALESSVVTGQTATDGVRKVYQRSAALKTYVRKRAGGACEGCERPAPFKDKKGQPYLEPHHTTRLADGGPDHPAHVIALCPTCHRRVHHGADGDAYNDALKLKLPALEPAAG